MYSFSYLEPVCCSMSSSNCCFLTCIQISQENVTRGKLTEPRELPFGECLCKSWVLLLLRSSSRQQQPVSEGKAVSAQPHT